MTGHDERWMQVALDEAQRGRFWTSPNPSVGCVLVRENQEIGRGFTQPAGGNHAEIQALNQAGDAKGATAYVTLEPCAHTGRTGPCADALVASGVSRVVIACTDPNPEVAGKGIAKLCAAGIDVSVGVLEAQAADQLQGFFLRMQRGYGRVSVKLGVSLDGRVAMASGESQWITGPESRADVQLLRAASCAVVTGTGTVLADDCSLTVRAPDLPLEGEDLEMALHRRPLRVVLDTNLRVPATAKVVDGEAPTLVFYGEGCGKNVPSERSVVETQAVATDDGSGLDLKAVLRALGARGCNEILVEAGGTLTASLLTAGLVDEFVMYQAPKLLGKTAQPMLNLALERLSDAVELEYIDTRKLGPDLRIRARLAHNNRG